MRKAKSTSIFIPSTFHVHNELEWYGTLVDLSTTGGLCQIKHKHDTPLPQIDLNTSILLRCLLPGIKEEQQINGKVRNLQIDPDEIRIGIEFVNLPPHLADTIGEYLYSIENLET